MSFSLIPHRVYPSIFDIHGPDLAARGITLLLADLDNTLAKYGQPDPDPAVAVWKDGISAAGAELLLPSNSRQPLPAGHSPQALGTPLSRPLGYP